MTKLLRLMMLLAALAIVFSSVHSSDTSVHSIDNRAASHHGTRALAMPIVHVKGNHLVNGAGKAMRLLGVDVNGTEISCVHSHTVSYGPLNRGEARVISSWGSNAVRVPLNEDCWLGINGLPKYYSKTYYQKAIKKWVKSLNSLGLVAVLDLHFSAPGTVPATRQWPMADETHSITFWREVVGAFRSDTGVVFDLFNEPALGKSHPTPSDWACWKNGCTARVRVCSKPRGGGACGTHQLRVAGMQQLVDTVRAAGARQPVMVGSLDWAGDPCGVSNQPNGNGTCIWFKYRPTDPKSQLVVSFHLYSTKKCNSLTCWNADVAPVAKKFPIVTGELGDKRCSSAFISSYMDWADRHGVSYLVWDWRPPSGRHTCSGQGTHLIANWAGRTNPKSPAPKAVQSHLRSEVRRQGGDF